MGTIGTVRALFEADTSGFDASLKSAVASLGQVGEQAQAASQRVDAATRLQEAAARRVQRVLAQVAAEQKALSGQAVTDGARRVADATLKQSQAYAELHRVQGLVRSDAVDAATKLDLLAAAQSRVASASAALAEAKQREGAEVELASVRAALAGQRVTEEALRTTAALRAQAEAQSLLSRTQSLVSSGAVAGPEGVQLLAAAQLRQVSAAAEVAAAKRAEAIAVKEAAEEEALSQNVVIRAFQRVAMVARESLDSIKEKLVETAEAAGLEAEGINASFAGLGKLFGAGIAVGFAAEYIDGIAKMNVELDHLATKTGIDIQQLAGLQQIVKEMGGEWDPVVVGLTRMQKAQVSAIENAKSASNAQVRAFRDIGISVQDLEHLSPEQLFVRVASGIAHIQEPAVAAASAIAIFGRGGAALIPIFKEQGDQLEANMKKTGALTGVTEKSAEAARRWTQDTARLSAEFRSVMMPVMEHAEDVVKGVGGAFMAAFSAVDTVLETAAAGVLSIVDALGGLGKVLYDIHNGNYGAVLGDATGTKDKVVKNFKDAFSDIGREWKKTYALFTEKNPAPPKMEGGDTDTDLSGLEQPDKGPKSHAAEEAARAQMQAFEHQADLLEEQGNADVFTMRAFWSKKMEAMQKGSAEYSAAAGNLNQDAIFHRLAEATKRMDAELEKSLHPKKDESGAAFEREQERAADESSRRITEIRQRAADEQAKLQERGQLSDVSIALSHGEISRYQALVAEAQIHAASFDAEIADVQRRLAEAEALRDLPGMQEQVAKLQAQLAQLKAQAGEQRQQDLSNIFSQTPSGALSDAFHQWEQQATDAASLIRKTFEETATGINSDLSKALTDPARTGYERMQNLKGGLSSTFRGVANQGIEFSLAKAESFLPGELGKLFGGGKKPTGAKGDPLYVAFDGGAGGARPDGLPGVLGGLVPSPDTNSGGGSDFGSFFSSLFGGSSSAVAPAAPASGIARTIPTLIERGFGSSDTSSSGGSDIFSSIFSSLGGSLGSAAGGDSSGGGDSGSGLGGIFSSIFSGLGGSSGGDNSGGSAASSGSSFLDSLVAFAPQQPSEGSASDLLYRSAPYTAADISMMQPGQQSPFVSMTAPEQQSPLVTTTAPQKKSGIGSVVQGLVGAGLKLIPGFATGGPIAPDMGAFIVGEEGPELLNIGSASAHVTPNHQLKSFGGGGDTHHHHWGPIDARGSNDPAAFEAALQRVAPRLMQGGASMGAQVVREQRLRTPSSAH